MQIDSIDAFETFVLGNAMAAVYFTGPDCGVCTVLKPALARLFANRFPAIAVAEVDCALHRDVAAQQSVFTVPTLIVFFDGREGMRKVRAFSAAQVEEELARPYSMLSEAGTGSDP